MKYQRKKDQWQQNPMWNDNLFLWILSLCPIFFLSLRNLSNFNYQHMATVDDKKIIFSMVGVSKIIPQNRKQILKDIYLSFFYGAKIGIIGLNGAGKSTLMKIIAGLEQPTQGEVVWSPGYTVGYLPQDPPLNEAKTVKENVMEGVQKVYDALAEYEDINAKFALE